MTAARSRPTDRGRAGFFPVAPSLSRRGQPACAYGAFFRRRKNRLLQRFAYAICPLRRDVRNASGRRASLPALSRGFDGLRRVEQRAGRGKRELGKLSRLEKMRREFDGVIKFLKVAAFQSIGADFGGGA